MTNEPLIQSVQIEDITIPTGRRQHTPEQIGALAQSIADVGQLQPIGLTEDYRLIFGAGRIAACQQLGLATVRAELHALEGLEAELAEIHENLRRSTLPPMEEASAMERSKEIYETLHPEARAVRGRGGPGRGHKTKTNLTAVSFVDDTAARTGRSASSIRRDLALATKIPDDVAAELAGTKVANNRAELGRLAKLSKAQQREAAKKLVSGEAKTVAEATGVGPDKDPVAEAGKVLGQLIRALDAMGLCEKLREPLQAITDAVRKAK